MPSPATHTTRAGIVKWTVIDHEPDPDLFALALRAPLHDRLADGDVLLLHASEGWCLTNNGRIQSHGLRLRLEKIRNKLGLSKSEEFRILIRCG
jgi:hypothetical protein